MGSREGGNQPRQVCANEGAEIGGQGRELVVILLRQNVWEQTLSEAGSSFALQLAQQESEPCLLGNGCRLVLSERTGRMVVGGGSQQW